MQSRNLAARAGRWSAQHRKKAILGWFAFVILATVLGGMVGQKKLSDEDMGNGESKRGDQIVEAAGFPEVTSESVLVQGKDGLTVKDPQFKAAVSDVVDTLGRTKGVSKIEDPLTREFSDNVSADGGSYVYSYRRNISTLYVGAGVR